MKKLFALLVALVGSLGLLSSCRHKTETPTPTPETPEVTPTPTPTPTPTRHDLCLSALYKRYFFYSASPFFIRPNTA